jgi:hypothetical protein
MFSFIFGSCLLYSSTFPLHYILIHKPQLLYVLLQMWQLL